MKWPRTIFHSFTLWFHQIWQWTMPPFLDDVLTSPSIFGNFPLTCLITKEYIATTQLSPNHAFSSVCSGQLARSYLVQRNCSQREPGIDHPGLCRKDTVGTYKMTSMARTDWIYWGESLFSKKNKELGSQIHCFSIAFPFCWNFQVHRLFRRNLLDAFTSKSKKPLNHDSKGLPLQYPPI